VTKINDKKI